MFIRDRKEIVLTDSNLSTPNQLEMTQTPETHQNIEASKQVECGCGCCCSSCLRLLSSPQVKGLFFLGLLASGHAINSMDSQNGLAFGDETDSYDKNREARRKEKILAQICQSKSAKPVNKPVGIAYGMTKQGEVAPQPCAGNKVDECKKELETEKSFLEDISTRKMRNDILAEARAKEKEEFAIWQNEFQQKLGRLGVALTEEQIEIYNGLIGPILELGQAYFRSKTPAQYDLGNCGEYSNKSLFDLFKKKIQFGIDLKIQIVQVEANHSKNRIKDHIYLLLDSDAPDCDAKTPAATTAILNQISKGKVCDVWNNGLFADFRSAESSFYQQAWETVKIKTVTLNFSQFENLPKELQKLLCEILSSIGLTVEPASQCEFGLKQRKNKAGVKNDEHVKEMRSII